MQRTPLQIVAGAALAFSFAVAPALASTVRPVTGTIVMARGGSEPMYLWNATDYVSRLVADKALGNDGMRALEASALVALADRSRDSSAKTVAIRVIYAKTGAVSPVYGNATFAGMEKVLTITVNRAALEKNVNAWKNSVANGATPASVKVDVTGSLPPE